MKQRIKTLCAGGLLALALVSRAAAGPIEDAHAAYLKGDSATALQIVRPLAEQGNAEAQTFLGTVYDMSWGTLHIPEDIAHAETLKWYRKAAEQGNAEGQAGLGLMYEQGQGVAQDYAEAARWFRRAADQGHVIAEVDLAELYACGGKGVAQDQAEAARWFNRAGEQAAWAQLYIANLYSLGWCVPQDYAEAAKWNRKAANQGDGASQYKLGMSYYNGQGVPQDYVLAHMWLNLAAAQGAPLAANRRMEVEAKMTPEQIAEAQRLAREWKPK